MKCDIIKLFCAENPARDESDGGMTIFKWIFDHLRRM